MTRRQLVALAALGSLGLLAGAWAFQHLFGYAPCKMCIWQRYPHASAAGLGALFLMLPWAPILMLGAASALITAGIGGFHVGVERGWWEGPASCSAGAIGNLSASDLMDQIMAAPLVRCDEIAWSLAGISMAGWNAILSLVLAVLWFAAWRRA